MTPRPRHKIATPKGQPEPDDLYEVGSVVATLEAFQDQGNHDVSSIGRSQTGTVMDGDTHESDLFATKPHDHDESSIKSSTTAPVMNDLELGTPTISRMRRSSG